MAVHYAFAATSHVVKSVPCVGESISLGELKDAVAAPLEAALKGRVLREKFDFRVYYADTNEEILDDCSRVRKHASVLVKRVPAYVVKQARNPSVPVVPVSLSNKISRVSESVDVDDEFGDDVFSSASTVTSKGVEKGPIVESVEKVESVGSDRKVESVKTVENVRRAGSLRRAESVRKVASVKECNNQRFEVSCRSEIQPPQSVEVPQIPQELMCFLCNNVMKDPALIRCCCNTFCADCIKVALVEQKSCPKCGSRKCGIADLLPNRHINSMIDSFVKSNPSVESSSSSASCSSTLTISSLRGVHPLVNQQTHCAANAANDTNQKTRVVDSVSGKRKPLIIQLNSSAKRSKVS